MAFLSQEQKDALLNDPRYLPQKHRPIEDEVAHLKMLVRETVPDSPMRKMVAEPLDQDESAVGALE
jgi:hypothetical protein